MLGFLKELARRTMVRKPRRPVKDVAVGTLVGALIGVGGALKPDWAFWLLLLYLTTIQALAFLENEMFFDMADLRRLGFREPNLPFRLTYISHYVARDATVANAIALVAGTTLLIIGGRAMLAVWLVVAVVCGLALLPSHVYLASRLSNRGRAAYVVTLYAWWGGLGIPLFLLGLSSEHWLPAAVPMTVALAAAAVLAVDTSARRLRNNGLASYGGRRLVRWLGHVSPTLFKDVLLLNGMVVQRLVTGAALFSLLAVGAPREALPGLVVVALGGDNLFLGRRHGQFRLLADDNLFSELALPDDRTRLRRSKLLTLTLDVLIKSVLIGLVLLVSGQLRPDLACTAFVVLVAAWILDGPVLYLDGRAGRALRHAVKYGVLAVFAAVTILGQPLGLAALTASVVGVVYLPSLLVPFCPKVTCRNTVVAGLAGATETPSPDGAVNEFARA